MNNYAQNLNFREIKEQVSQVKAEFKSIGNVDGIQRLNEYMQQLYASTLSDSTEINKLRSSIESSFGTEAVEQFNQALLGIKEPVSETEMLVEKLRNVEQQLRACGETAKANKIKEYMQETQKKTIDVDSSINELRADIEKCFGTDAVNEFNKKLNETDSKVKSISKKSNFGSSLKTALGIGTVALGIRKGWNFLKSSTNESVDFVEQQNLFNVSMGKIVDQYGNLDREASKYYLKATAFQDKLSEKLGINIAESMKYQALFNAMSKSMGIAEEHSYKLSENFTKLGYDLSSLYNIDPENAMQKLRAGLSGQTKPLRDLGLDITQQSLEPLLDELGIERSVKQLSQAEKMVARYIVVLRQASLAHGDFAKTMDSPANQLRIFNAQVAAFKRNMGNLWQGLLGGILPYVNAIIMVINELLKMVAKLFGFEVKEQANISASIGADDLADDLGTATGKAKELKKQLMGFDEINNITLPKDSSLGVSVGGIDQRLLDAMKEYDNMMDKVKSKATDIRDKMLEWLGFIRNDDGTWKLGEGYTNLTKIWEMVKTIGIAFASWKVSSAVATILEKLGVLDKTGAFKYAFGITLSITGTYMMYNGISHILDGNADLFSMLETILGAGSTTLGILSILKATKHGKELPLGKQASFSFGIAFTIAGLIAQYKETKKAFRGDADFTDVLGSIAGTASTGIGIATVLKSLKTGSKLSLGKALTIGFSVSFAIQGLEGLYSTMQEIKNETIKTEDAIKNIVVSSAETTTSLAILGGTIGGPLGAGIGATVGIIGSLVTGLIGAKNATKETNTETSMLIKEFNNLTQAHGETINSINATKEADLLALEVSKDYEKQLEDLVDADGHVIAGNEARVDFILNELNKALGLELKRDGEIITKNGEVMTSYQKVKGSIDEKIKSLEKEIKLNAYKQLAEEELKYYIEAKKKRKEYTQQVIETKEKQKKAYSEASSAAKKAMDEAYKKADDTIKQMEQQETNAYKNYQDYLKSYENETLNTVDNISNGVQEGTKNISDAVENEVDTTITTIQGKATDARNSGYIIGSSITDGIDSGGSTVSQIGQNIVSKFSSGISSLISLAKSAGINLGNGANSGVSSSVSTSTQLGKDFANGYINGIKSLVSKVTSTATNLVKSALSAIQWTQDSHSPSKITKGLGYDFGEGYTLGIKNMMPDAIKSATELAKNTTEALNNNIGNIDNFDNLSKGIKIDSNDIKINATQYVDYGQISGAIAMQSSVNINSDIDKRIENAIYRGLSNATIPVEIEARADEGVIFKKVQVKAREFTMQTGEPAFEF